MYEKLNLPVSKLAGIGKVKAAAFEKLCIHTVRDLLYHFPTRYENRGAVGKLADVNTEVRQSYLLTVGTVPKTSRLGGGRTVTHFRAFDDSGSIDISYFNQAYVADKFHIGEEYRFYGRITEKARRYSLPSPIAERVRRGESLPSLYAVYPLCAGLNKNTIRKAVREALLLCADETEEFLPREITEKYSLMSLCEALEKIHFPPDITSARNAAYRFAFDEMLMWSLASRLIRDKREKARAYRMKNTDISAVVSAMPFEFTGAQRRTVSEIIADMSRGDGDFTSRMSRIVVGDVGSGKTACAEAAIYLALINGTKAVLMAPTEILADQHFAYLSKSLGRLGFTVEKLTGSVSAAEKRRIKEELTKGKCDLVVGTHALIEADTAFPDDTGLVVCDEQHRFGMMQRAKLLEKAPLAHMLVMSATPIPRTLSLVLCGDLDISKIDEMPKGRQPVSTHLVTSAYRERLNGFIEKEVADGGRVYVVCPAIEAVADDADADGYTESIFAPTTEAMPQKTAVGHAEELAKRFPSLSVACIHGKMKPSEKNGIMTRFAAGEINILVSTTVIEVGINVPEATLMIVENAERFGLSQLHQLRGRVGRGSKKSYCILVSDSESESSLARLRLLCRTSDGFVIADEDLKTRGAGDLLGGEGARQSGENRLFRMAESLASPELLERAACTAELLMAKPMEKWDGGLIPIREKVFRMTDISDNTVN